MAIVDELIRSEADGGLSFGNYTLDSKSKVSDFEHEGDLYKVKTFKEITKLEKNGMFVYESVPGTTVTDMKVTEDSMNFDVSGKEDAQITLELEAEKDYKIIVNDAEIGDMKTNLGGKLVFSLVLEEDSKSSVCIKRL
ncbi:MAG: endosialidase [Lachnospiraceae bacterium]|nr:endosialidase [Lachnospiraceae bacterium]